MHLYSIGRRVLGIWSIVAKVERPKLPKWSVCEGSSRNWIIFQEHRPRHF